MSTNALPTNGLVACCVTWHWVQKYRLGETDARNWPSRFMKWVMLTIGALESAVARRLWHDMHLFAFMSI